MLRLIMMFVLTAPIAGIVGYVVGHGRGFGAGVRWAQNVAAAFEPERINWDDVKLDAKVVGVSPFVPHDESLRERT